MAHKAKRRAKGKAKHVHDKARVDRSHEFQQRWPCKKAMQRSMHCQQKGIQTNMSTGDRLLDAMAMQEGTDEPQAALMGDDTDNGGTELNVQQVHVAWESAVAQAAMETYEAGCLKAADFLWKPMTAVENVES